jgi:hypothetical protein
VLSDNAKIDEILVNVWINTRFSHVFSADKYAAVTTNKSQDDTRSGESTRTLPEISDSDLVVTSVRIQTERRGIMLP